MSDKKSFIFMLDWLPWLESLDTREEILELFAAIKATVNGEDFEVTSRRVIPAWKFIKPKLEANLEKWEEERQKRAEAGRLGGIASGEAKRSKTKQNEAMLSNAKQDEANRSKGLANEADTVTVTVTDTVTDTDSVSTNPPNGVLVDSVKENSKEKRFIKPTLEEIELFIFDNNYSVDAEAFFDYYESVGWSVGKKKMKDWKAAVRTWQKREQPKYGDSFFDVD